MRVSSGEIWPDAPVELSGYQFVRLIGVTTCSRRSLYKESDKAGHVLVEEIHPGVCALDGFDDHYQRHMERNVMIGHPSCLRILSHGRGPTGSYLILREWVVEGIPLQEWTGGRPVDPAVALSTCVEIGWAVSAMHDNGVCHGSLDGYHVWLDAQQKPRLEVFPVSAVVESFFQQDGQQPLTDPTVDVRALAALAYAMLTGQPPPATHDGMFFPPYLSQHAKRVISDAYASPPAPPYGTMAGFCSDLLRIACAPSEFDTSAQARLKKPTSHLMAMYACILVLVGLTGFLAYRQIFGGVPPRGDTAAVGNATGATDATAEEDTIVLTDEIPGLFPDPEEEVEVVDMPEEPDEEVVEPGGPETGLQPAARVWSQPPQASLMAGDAFIYAGHFYLGDQVGLLKLQFGNAGEWPLDIAELSFQCAFSVDDKLDSLAPATAGTMPEDGLDVAAGGFTGTWLGMGLQPLASQGKVWMRQTFRIDTSNRELLGHAKFLIVKISPFYQIPEANYKNNIIAIPLENPNQWNTATLDPKDFEAEGDAKAD